MAIFLCLLGFAPIKTARAVGVYVQSATATGNAVKTLNVALTSPARVGNLIIVVCAAGATSTMSMGTTGYLVAAPSAGTTVSQAIFYKVAVGGETTVTCNSTVATRLGAHIYEYNGTLSSAPFDGTATASSTIGTALTSGSFTPTTTNSLVFAGFVAAGGTGFTPTTAGATERTDFRATRHYGGTDIMATTGGAKAIAVTNTASGAWRGQLAVFKLKQPLLSADIVNASGVSVAAPALSFSATTFGFNCQTVAATLGVTTEQLSVSNTTATPGWALSIAATSGAAATWSDGGTNKYDYNDATTAGCADGTDADTFAGQMTINPSVATITPAAGCTATGVAKGAQTAFIEGTTNAITIATASATAPINCRWNITGLALSQTIPAEQVNATYSLGLTLTIIAQ
ncbi:MAG: hypothetical protein WAQ24_04750 [Candidatus Saccharimonadales bacterium]